VLLAAYFEEMDRIAWSPRETTKNPTGNNLPTSCYVGQASMNCADHQWRVNVYRENDARSLRLGRTLVIGMSLGAKINQTWSSAGGSTHTPWCASGRSEEECTFVAGPLTLRALWLSVTRNMIKMQMADWRASNAFLPPSGS
jgi:hypothetical protein